LGYLSEHRAGRVDSQDSASLHDGKSKRTSDSEPVSALAFAHERGDPCLFASCQPLQCVGVRPHVAFVEVRFVAEARRRVPRFELLRWLEEADDLIVLGARGWFPGVESERFYQGGLPVDCCVMGGGISCLTILSLAR
jgi:hypothetical protein